VRPVRFTIATLIAVVAFAAVAIAALREASELWDSSLFSLTFAALLVATLLAVHRTGRSRAFWGGFALFGWAYLISSLIPPVEARLLTTKGLGYLESKRPGRQVTRGKLYIRKVRLPIEDGGGPAPVTFRTVDVIGSQPSTVTALYKLKSGTFLAAQGGTPEDFVRIGHSLIALLLAFLGGHASRLLYGRSEDCRDSENLNPPMPSSPPELLP
jgi:hypothetical protein